MDIESRMDFAVDISPDFTIEDIHKIRDARYAATHGMTADERIAFYNALGDRAQRHFDEWKARNGAAQTA